METPAASLTVAGASSNTALVPLANIVFGGSGASRTVTVTPAANQSGAATITLTVTDLNGGTANDSFVLTVLPVNDVPTISNVTDKTTTEDTVSGPHAFTIGDVETAAAVADGLGNVIEHHAGAGRQHRLRWQRREPHGDDHAGADSVRNDHHHPDRERRHWRHRERPLRADRDDPQGSGARRRLRVRRGQRDHRRGRLRRIEHRIHQRRDLGPAGRFGGALSFDGNDWVTVADTAVLGLRTGLTLEAWVRPSTDVPADWRTIILKERTGGLAYSLYSDTGEVRAPIGYINTGGVDDLSAAGVTRLLLDTWTHLATTFDGTQLRIYVNGVQVGSRTVTGNIVASAGPLRFGGNSVWGEYFNGLIDEIRLYDGARTQAEIQADMDTPVQGAAAPTRQRSPTSRTRRPTKTRRRRPSASRSATSKRPRRP